jgi:hypothetical protein
LAYGGACASRHICDIFRVSNAHRGCFDKIWSEIRSAETGDVDVLTRFSGDRQDLVDGEIGMVASVALKAGQPFKLNGGKQIVVLE